MTVELHEGVWEINGEYYINGDTEDGYYVCLIGDENQNILFESKSFEECLVWCYNS